MKNLKRLIAMAVTAVFTASFATAASADFVIGLDASTFKFSDPVSYEAKLSEYPTLRGNGYTTGLDFVSDIPSDAEYIADDTAPGGSGGYLSHKSAAAAAGMIQMGIGDGELQGFLNSTQAPLPGNLGRQKIEVVFRFNNTANASGDIFDIRNFYVKNDGTAGTNLIGMKVTGKSGDGLVWNTRLDSSNDGGGGTMNPNTWYKMVVYTDIPRNIQSTYLEQWNGSSFTVARNPFDMNLARCCDGINVHCFENAARVRFTNAMDWDIAQIKITRDNTLYYKENPNDETFTSADKIERVLPGLATNKLNADGQIVARTYIAGNAFGTKGDGTPTDWYTYADGSYAPKVSNPILVIAQYDENGKLVDADFATAETPTLNAGYRTGKVECNPTVEPTEGNVAAPVLQHKLEFKKLEIKMTKADETKKAKIFLWNYTDSLNPLKTAEEFTY